MKPKFDRMWRIADIADGQPCFKGTGVLVEFIVGCFLAGDSVESLAENYDVDQGVIIEAIRLVLAGSYGQRGLLRQVERRMTDMVPLTDRASL
jgi:uncharacterized protein (DUF433 family)